MEQYMFYTSVTKIGNNLYHRYVKDGIRYSDVVKHHSYELFLKSDHANDAVDIYNSTLKRYKFDNIFDMNQFVKEQGNHNVLGNTDPAAQFISNVYGNDIELTQEYMVLNFDIETEHASGIPKYHYSTIIDIQYEDGRTQQIKLNEVKTIKEPILVYDIEKNTYTEFENSCFAPKELGFPDPYLAICEILSISMIQSHKNIIYVLGTKDYTGITEVPDSEYTIEHIHCKSEKELLVKFIQMWREIKPDIVTGWNIDGFDIPYVVNRISRVLGKKFANMLSPYSNDTQSCIREKQTEDGIFYTITGVNIFDYMDLYKKFARSKQESYRLDWIGEVEVGHKKISYEEYDNSLMKLWEYDYNKFVLYNAIDSLIVTKIDAKLKFIDLAITIAHLTKSDLGDALGTVKPWDNLIYNMLKQKNVQIPPNIKKEKYKEFLGAKVKDPILGMHDWIISSDAASLYPSIIRMFNMSPETLRIREIGSNQHANSEQLMSLHSDLYDINEELQTSGIDRTRKNELLDQKAEKEGQLKYYSSGHEYLFGADNVLDNIELMHTRRHDTDFAKKLNVTLTGNGSCYTKEFEGVIPKAMTFLYNYRKKMKEEMKSKKRLLQAKLLELKALE